MGHYLKDDRPLIVALLFGHKLFLVNRDVKIGCVVFDQVNLVQLLLVLIDPLHEIVKLLAQLKPSLVEFALSDDAAIFFRGDAEEV